MLLYMKTLRFVKFSEENYCKRYIVHNVCLLHLMEPIFFVCLKCLWLCAFQLSKQNLNLQNVSQKDFRAVCSESQ